MAWLRVDAQHQEILELLVSSPRVASVAGRTRTGPFPELRQVVVLAATIGFAAKRRQPVAKAGDTAIRDSILMGANAAPEVAFALAYHDEGWDLSVVADGDVASDRRLKIMEEYAGGGFEILREKFAELGGSVSATELLDAVRRTVRPPDLAYPRAGIEIEVEDPLIAVLRRSGKLPEA